jgi:hypothetical protein
MPAFIPKQFNPALLEVETGQKINNQPAIYTQTVYSAYYTPGLLLLLPLFFTYFGFN